MTPDERAKQIERLRAAGRKGGLATRRKRGKKYFREIGRRGGEVIKARWRDTP